MVAASYCQGKEQASCLAVIRKMKMMFPLHAIFQPEITYNMSLFVFRK